MAKKETMWMAAYWDTLGIFKAEGRITELHDGEYFFCMRESKSLYAKVGNGAFASKADAIKKVDKEIQNKILILQAKVEELTHTYAESLVKD